LVIKTLDPDPDWNLAKMLDPDPDWNLAKMLDPDSMKPDPKHWL
jgi:hypothetical protein